MSNNQIFKEQQHHTDQTRRLMYMGETHMENIGNLNHLKHVTPGNTRPAIGLMCVKPDNECSINMWSGVRDTAWEHGINLIYFAGGELGSPVYDQANIVYELVNPEHLDGLVIWGTQFAHYAALSKLRFDTPVNRILFQFHIPY